MSNGIWTFAPIVLIFVLYFLPAFVGRKKRDHRAILILNLLAGWTVVGWIVTLVWAFTKDMEESICQNCGFSGMPKKYTKGSFWIELILWFCFLIPGLIYSMWRLTTKYEGCRHCKVTNLVPVDSPRGRKLIEEFQKQEG